MRLSDLAGRGVKFISNGIPYAPAEVGEELQQAWSVIFGEQELIRTLLLKKAT